MSARRLARLSAIRRRATASSKAGRAAVARRRSSAYTGRSTSRKTADLRSPLGSTNRMNRFTGSDHPGRASTLTLPASTVANAPSTSIAARSTGVCVAAASARTYAPRGSGRALSGKGAAGRLPRATGGNHPSASTEEALFRAACTKAMNSVRSPGHWHQSFTPAGGRTRTWRGMIAATRSASSRCSVR